jgi:hypothetical protein
MNRICAPFVVLGTVLFGSLTHAQILVPPAPATQPAAPSPTSPPAAGRGLDRASLTVTKHADGTGAEGEGEVLSYSVSKGSVENFNISIRTQNAMAMGATPTGFPPSADVTMQCVLTVEDVAASGEITYVVRFVSGSVLADTDFKPKDLEDLRSAVQAFGGTSLRVRIDAGGAPLASDWVQPPVSHAAATMDAFKQVATRLAMVLPEEKIVLPATWKNAATQKMNTIDATATSTLDVTRNERGELSAKVELTRTAPPQEMPTPASAPHAKQSLESLVGAGLGESVRRLDRISPVRMTIRTETDVKFAVGMKAHKGQPEVNESFSQKFRQTVRIE